MIYERDVVDFLIKSHLLQPQDILEHGVSIANSSRRNYNYLVQVSGRRSFFLKHQREASDGNGTLAREAEAYRFLSNHRPLPKLRNALPGLVQGVSGQCILVTDLKEGGRTLLEYHKTRRALSKHLFRQLGQVLSDLHSIDRAGVPAELATFFRPLPLDFPELPASIFFDASAANLEVVRLIQSSDIVVSNLRWLKEGWTQAHLIHGDLKSDNFIATAAPGASRVSRLTVVDWEFCSLGDPLWDVGSVLADCIAMWLNSIPLSSDMSEENWVQSARFPLERMKPAIAAFWRAYVGRREMSGMECATLLERSIGYCAARLLQTAYEKTQLASSVDGRTACFIQIAENLFSRPLEAATHLLGIPPDARSWFDEPLPRTA